MTSESTRFLGQPRETKPTLGRVCREAAWESETLVSSIVAGGVTDFYFSKFARLERLRETSWERIPTNPVQAALGTGVTKLWTKRGLRLRFIFLLLYWSSPSWPQSREGSWGAVD